MRRTGAGNGVCFHICMVSHVSYTAPSYPWEECLAVVTDVACYLFWVVQSHQFSQGCEGSTDPCTECTQVLLFAAFFAWLPSHQCRLLSWLATVFFSTCCFAVWDNWVAGFTLCQCVRSVWGYGGMAIKPCLTPAAWCACALGDCLLCNCCWWGTLQTAARQRQCSGDLHVMML